MRLSRSASDLAQSSAFNRASFAEGLRSDLLGVEALVLPDQSFKSFRGPGVIPLPVRKRGQCRRDRPQVREATNRLPQIALAMFDQKRPPDGQGVFGTVV